MNLQLNPLEISTIIAAIVIVAGVVALLYLQRRMSERLHSTFDQEYERAVTGGGGDRRRAEARRTERVERFHPRQLNTVDRVRFAEAWARIQAHFVNAPTGAVAEADQLIGDVMATRGYPVAEFEQRAAEIAVDHPLVTQNYRSGHEVAVRQTRGQARTEDLRRAMIHYRALFDDLISDSGDVEKKPITNEGVNYSVDPAIRVHGD